MQSRGGQAKSVFARRRGAFVAIRTFLTGFSAGRTTGSSRQTTGSSRQRERRLQRIRRRQAELEPCNVLPERGEILLEWTSDSPYKPWGSWWGFPFRLEAQILTPQTPNLHEEYLDEGCYKAQKNVTLLVGHTFNPKLEPIWFRTEPTEAINLKPQTPSPKPQTLNPNPEALNPKSLNPRP